MEFTVKAVDAPEVMSKAQIEQELLNKHEQEIRGEAQPPVITEEQIQPPALEFKDEDVLSYLGKRLNKTITSYEDLIEVKEQELPEDVAAYYKFKKDTNRGFDDFMKSQRDVDKVDKDTLIRDYFLAKEDELDKEDVEAMMQDFTLDEIDEELDLEEDIKRKKDSNRKKELAKKKTFNEAKKFFNTQKEQYKMPLVSSEASVPAEEKEEFESYKQYMREAATVEEQNTKKRQTFQQKTEELFTPEFKGFEFKIGEKSFMYSPETAIELKTAHTNPGSFINKFLDENGLIKDAAGYNKSLAMARNPDKFAQYFYEQGIADAVEKDAKETKNISMGMRQTPVSAPTSGITASVVNKNQNPGRSLKVIRKG